MCGQDDLASVSLCCKRNACWTGVAESFSPLSSRIASRIRDIADDA